jgi:hypothetical protein
MQLSVVFVGLALFERNGGTYLVSLPDGRDLSQVPSTVHQHAAAVWIRPRTAVPSPHNWPFPSRGNDYEIAGPSKLSFTGLKQTPSVQDLMYGQVPKLTESDVDYKPDHQKVAIAHMKIDTGRLIAHKLDMGMIVVEWVVESAGVDPIQLTCEPLVGSKQTLTLKPETRQIMIANVPADDIGSNDDFNLYKNVGTSAKLLCPKDVTVNNGGVKLDDPTHMAHESNAIPQCKRMIETPLLACSPGTYP